MPKYLDKKLAKIKIQSNKNERKRVIWIKWIEERTTKAKSDLATMNKTQKWQNVSIKNSDSKASFVWVLFVVKRILGKN